MESECQVWFNGVLREADRVSLSPFDHGVTVGNGVFETLIAYEGMPFAFRRHHERLVRSAAVMDLSVPVAGILRDAVEAVITANALAETPARVRVTVTGGPSPLGSERGTAGTTVMVAATPAPFMGDAEDVWVVPFTRNENGALAGVKSTSYGENVVALTHAKDRGAGEAILGNTKGDLCEGTGTNVFLVDGEGVVTPPLESGCLAGVTRALVLELCEREGIPAREETLPLEALRLAREAFLTSTTREVQPISSVDGMAMLAVPGEMTARLARAFRNLVEETMDP
jgi:branched-chain amino acid aminotransferase